jgi:hypothetical protein
VAREILNHLDRELASVTASLKELVNSVPQHLLYQHPPEVSFGENILRSAAVIEQVCGGLTANLWDDPFEWTLPETLSNPDRIVEYLSEVDAARQRAFDSIQDDTALTKYISDPNGERLLISLLIETLVKASKHKGRALDRIHKRSQD